MRALLEHADEYRSAARGLIERRPSIVRLIGHGSSDAAAAFAVYAFGLLPGWTAVRDSISLVVFGHPCLCLGLKRLIEVKRAAGRLKDLEAIAEGFQKLNVLEHQMAAGVHGELCRLVAQQFFQAAAG